MNKETEYDYGTSGGIKITEELIEKYVREAEEGYDISELKPLGRPLNVDGVLEVVPVRMEEGMRIAIRERAIKDGTTGSDIIRKAVKAFLHIS
ncbi:MAG TPA: CopG family transcriptional regulator [Acidimicrobiia bacterium]|jgi:hypothetical protein|nr:CopG family transcriptional regulator [Acidimicrobiia bacterium]